MVASSVSWMPAQGRHSVNIGPSLGRAIKARKLKDSPAPAKRSNLPEREFYSLRYNFKPGTMDGAKPASIETKRVVDTTQIAAEFPNKDLTEVAAYNGTEVPAKEIECVLIYDEDTGQYSLEKLDSFISLQFTGKKPSSTPAVPDKGKRKQEEEEDDLERLILDELDEKDTRPTPKYTQPEDLESGEEPEIPLALARPSPSRKPDAKKPPPTATAPSRAMKPLPKARDVRASLTSTSKSTPVPTGKAALPPKPSVNTSTSTSMLSTASDPPPTASKPKTAPKPKQKKPKPLPSSTAASVLPDEEVIQISKPATSLSKKAAVAASRQPKAVAHTPAPPPPKAPAELSLPGVGDSSFVPLPAAAQSSKKVPASAVTAAAIGSGTPLAVPPGVSEDLTMEEFDPAEDADWGSSRALEDELFEALGGEGEDDGDDDMVEQDIDAADPLDALEAELNQEMDLEADVFGGGDDWDEDDDMEEVSVPDGPIMSLNKMATGLVGVEAESDDDIFSSSDSESD